MAESNDRAPFWLPMIREIYAGLIAVLVLGLFLAMIVRALGNVTDAATFGQVKDLLAIVNPIVGLIIGYYFSRVTSEARAEKAETAAAVSAKTATAAMEGKSQADREVAAARDAVAKSAKALESLVCAVDKTRGTPTTEGLVPQDVESALPASATTIEIDLALDRARRVLARSWEQRIG